MKSRQDVVKNSLAVFVVLVVSVLGVKLLMASQAATGATLSLTTSATTVTPNSTVSITIKEDSGTDPVNSVQASLNYDATQLQYLSMTEGTAFPTIAANSTSTPGVIRVGRATQGTPVTGSNNLVTLNFKVLATTGIAPLTFDKNFSFVVRSTDNADILGTTTGINLTVNGGTGASASMSLSPGTGTAANGSTFTVTIRENSDTTPVNAVQSSVSYDATQLQFTGLAEGNTFTTQAATDTGTAGRIRVARSVASGSAGVTGDNPVVILSFKVLASSGTTALTIDKTQSFVTAASNSADILATVAGSSFTLTGSNPTGTATLSMSPTSGSFAQDSTVSVIIKATSPTAPLTTVQAAINYPASQLQYVSTTEGTVFTTAQRTNTSTPGLVDIIRSIPGGNAGVTGTNPVVTINFKVIGTSGAAALTYASTSAIYDDSGTGTDILDRAGSTTANYTITSTVPTCTTNPSAPGTPTKTASNYTTTTFSWTASTPGANCTLSGYQIFRGASQVGTVATGTSFTDSGLSAGTSYSYTVKATDTTGHTSAASTAANISTKADDMSPTTPVGVTASAPNASSVNLSWTASTDFPNPGGVGVAGYNIYRDGATTPTYTVLSGTTFTDTNVVASTTYSYTIRAFDNVNNESAPSNIVSARTAAPTCSGTPSTPSGLTAGTSTLTTTTLSWNASTASAGCTLAGYHIFRDSVMVGTVATTSFQDTGLLPGTSYNYTVQAYDTSAHNSSLSTARTIATLSDTTAPSAPSGVTGTAVSAGLVTVAWNASTDNVAVTGYKVYRGGSLINTASAAARSFNDTTVSANTNYTYTVSAIDGSGNESAKTTATPNPVHTPTGADSQAPSTPTSLRSLTVSTNTVVLAWNASTDNVGVAGYHIYRGGTYLGDATGLSYTSAGLAASTAYSFTVKAFDAAGNTSAASTALSVTTLDPILTKVGDLNGDDTVNIFDLSIMMTHWQEVNVPVKFGDIDQDGKVNIFDLSILLSHLGDKV